MPPALENVQQMLKYSFLISEIKRRKVKLELNKFRKYIGGKE